MKRKLGKRIWSHVPEASAQAVRAFWQEKFGEPLLLGKAVRVEIIIDTHVFHMPNNHSVVLGKDLTEVYETGEGGM